MTSARNPRPRVRVLIGAATALGPGRVDLLAAVAETGSIAAAARRMGMSYRKAWLLIDSVNRCFVEDLVVRTAGGRGGGGAEVTALGHEVLRRYRAMEAKAEASLKREMAAFGTLLADRSD